MDHLGTTSLVASLLLVALPFSPSTILVPSSKARSPVRSVLAHELGTSANHGIPWPPGPCRSELRGKHVARPPHGEITQAQVLQRRWTRRVAQRLKSFQSHGAWGGCGDRVCTRRGPVERSGKSSGWGRGVVKVVSCSKHLPSFT